MSSTWKLNEHEWTIPSAILFVCGYFYVLCVNGAVPGFTLPTLGQSIWLGGFASSLASGDWFSLWAYDIGGPEPSPVVFGLAVVLPISAFVRWGLHLPDAYTLAFALWFLVAFWAAHSLLRMYKVGILESIAGATVWLCLPITWQHAGYSALSLSFGLLPAYFLMYLRFYERTQLTNAILLFATCLVALFMDGYGFMFFFVATGLHLVYEAVKIRAIRIPVLVGVFLCFTAAYVCYALYIGQTGFGRSSLNHFRGWGMDLSFAILPTRGLFAIPDILSFSVPRSSSDFFGDSSVFRTTFVLHLLLPAGILLFLPYGNREAKILFALLAFIGFYFALGPSFKFLNYRPEGVPRGMLAEYALGPTGTGWISAYVPGFYNLRASYRWITLAMLGAWAICYIGLADPRLKRIYLYAFSAFALLLVLPHPTKIWSFYTKQRETAFQMETDFTPLKNHFADEEMVAFVPSGNDFLINFLAPYLKINAYNIGGDKNVVIARRQWPKSMLHLAKVKDNPDFARHARELLENGHADAIAISKINLLWAAHSWPHQVELPEGIAPHLETIRNSGDFEVIDTKYFVIVRLI